MVVNWENAENCNPMISPGAFSGPVSQVVAFTSVSLLSHLSA